MASVEETRLAVGAVEAAKMLGVSPRTVWALTRSGRLPHVRLGRRIVYPVEALRAWLAAEARNATALV